MAFSCVAGELIDNHPGDLEPSQADDVGDALQHDAFLFFDADQVIEGARNSASDVGGEWAEDHLDDVTAEDREALNVLLLGWAAKFPIRFYGIENAKDYFYTAEDPSVTAGDA